MNTAALQAKEIALIVCDQIAQPSIPKDGLVRGLCGKRVAWRSACSSVIAGKNLGRRRSFHYAGTTESNALFMDGAMELGYASSFFRRKEAVSALPLHLQFFTPVYMRPPGSPFDVDVPTPCVEIQDLVPEDRLFQSTAHPSTFATATNHRASASPFRKYRPRIPFRPSVYPPPVTWPRYNSKVVASDLSVSDLSPPHPRKPEAEMSDRQEGELLLLHFKYLLKDQDRQPVSHSKSILKDRARHPFETMWSAYTALRDRALVSKLHIDELFLFAEYLEIEVKDDVPLSRHAAGLRLRQVLDELESRPVMKRVLEQAPKIPEDGLGVTSSVPHANLTVSQTEWRFRRLDAWCHILLDQWEDGCSRLRELFRKGNGIPHPSVVLCMHRVIRDAWQLRSADAALDIILDGFDHLEPCIRPDAQVQTWMDHDFRAAVVRVRRVTLDIIESIKLPVEWLAEKQSLWDEQRLRRANRLFLRGLVERDYVEFAQAVYAHARRRNHHIPLGQACALVDCLALDESYFEAETVFREVLEKQVELYPGKPWHTSMVKTAMRLAAHQGQVEKTVTHYRTLRSLGLAGSREKNWLMHASAVDGQPEHVEELFSTLFPGHPMTASRPNAAHFTTVILAHARQGDLTNANRWLERMISAGFTADLYVYNIILTEFAKRGDVSSLESVTAQMEASGVGRNGVTYTALITFYARRKDPINAEAAMRSAMAEGLRPDRHMLRALVNVHIATASWKGVIRIFDYVMNLPYQKIRLTSDLCTTLLTAYVLVGAPYYTVRGVFRRLRDFGVPPNQRAYARVIQSACDSGRMEEAEVIFAEMQKVCELAEDAPANLYSMTTIMAGYLRKKDRPKARDVYLEMIRRNIQPSSATFAIIVNDHASEGTLEGLQLAEEFLADVLKENLEGSPRAGEPRSSQGALKYLFNPIMNGYAKNFDPAQVERLFAWMRARGGEEPLESLTVLMDAYARVGNIDAVQQVWERLHKQGLELLRRPLLFAGLSKFDSLSKSAEAHGGHPYANWLAIPLSVYIDALSAAQRHTQVAETVMNLRKEGFTFDAHNWNRMAVAMLRAGEPERAFEVLEKVILRYQEESERLVRERDVHPDSPFIFDQPPEVEMVDPMDNPAERMKTRAQRVLKTEKEVPQPGQDVQGEDEIQSVQDLVQTLHVLHQVAPSWHLWRPHAATLRALGLYLSDTGSGDAQDEEKYVDLGLSTRVTGPDVLHRIYSNYPMAVSVVQRYMASRRARRGM